MAYVITLLAMATIAVFSAFFIFKDKHPKHEK
jgi:hypothetical protein